MQNLTISIKNQLYPIIQLTGRPKALLDKTVAEIYGVKTKHINQAISRNLEKFPPDFYFELTPTELKYLNESKDYEIKLHGRHLPKALTHLGCNMLATILKSEKAIRRSVDIIRAFTELEHTGISSIQDIKEMLFLQNQIIMAMNNQLQDLGLKQNKDITQMLKKINKIEKKLQQFKQPPLLINTDSISEDEISILKDMAKSKSRSRKQIMKLWSDFKARFKITRYIHLPKTEFQNALIWLSNWKY